MSRSLIDLHPEVRWRAEKVLEAASEISIPILIYFTLRTFAEQQALYEQGRKTPGQIVTKAKAGESYHNYGLAFDFVPTENGKPKWGDLNSFKQVGELGESLGLQWGGRWPKFKDYPHFQLSFGFNTQELRVFYEIGGLPRVWEEISKKNEKNKWP